MSKASASNKLFALGKIRAGERPTMSQPNLTAVQNKFVRAIQSKRTNGLIVCDTACCLEYGRLICSRPDKSGLAISRAAGVKRQPRRKIMINLAAVVVLAGTTSEIERQACRANHGRREADDLRKREILLGQCRNCAGARENGQEQTDPMQRGKPRYPGPMIERTRDQGEANVVAGYLFGGVGCWGVGTFGAGAGWGHPFFRSGSSAIHNSFPPIIERVSFALLRGDSRPVADGESAAGRSRQSSQFTVAISRTFRTYPRLRVFLGLSHGNIIDAARTPAAEDRSDG